MMPIKKLTDVDIHDRRVIIREDFNVPMANGAISNDNRIQAALPTIEYALKQQAKIILLSHLGRPSEGDFDPKYSLEPIASYLSKMLKQPVQFEKNYLNSVQFNNSHIILCENVRFNVGEKVDDENLSKKLAALCDVFVMDAFASAHRAHASTHGIAKFAKIACAGPLLIKELSKLKKCFTQAKHPIVAIVGGSKISTKLKLLENFIKKVDTLILGGGIANTFLAAKGHNVGKSLFEPELRDKALDLIKLAKEFNVKMPLPVDVKVATEFSENTTAKTKIVNQINDDEMILDVGPETANTYANQCQQAGTIIWNGPVGVFEFKEFSTGTHILAKAIATSKAYSIAGGGDTVAAIDKFKLHDGISYLSTGGGAFLAFLQGDPLPGIIALEK